MFRLIITAHAVGSSDGVAVHSVVVGFDTIEEARKAADNLIQVPISVYFTYRVQELF